MKKFSRSIVAALVVALCFTAFACGDKGGQNYDPETRPLVMSIQTPDGVFNPFFATSGYDTTIVGMTQISMLSADKNGGVTYGDDEPVVVKDMQITTTGTGDDRQTTYEFILKKGIRFSDGTELTIKDVLFNLYVYLDPVYTGSSTVYSTDIVGLQAYRTQNPNATDGSSETFEQSFVDDAAIRIQDIIDYVMDVGVGTSADEKPGRVYTEEQKARIEADFVTAKETFAEELSEDWNSYANNRESYSEQGFTATWQIFMVEDGQMTELYATDDTGDYIENEDGNLVLDAELAQQLVYDEIIQPYLTEHNATDDNREALIRECCINEVLSSKFGDTPQTTQATGVEEVLTYWVTAQTLLEDFAAELKSEYFASSDRAVPSVTGIDGTRTRTTDFAGNDLGSAHEVLTITINDIDPKAIWNFAFTVAPMHYYSSTNWRGKNYVEAFDQSRGEFGLEFGSVDFFDEVINAPAKVGLPVGAGVYMASTASGGAAQSAGDFNNLNMIYFERNPYFETLGGSIHNANIKYVRYKVTEADQVINSLTTGDVDFGDPNATQDNIDALAGASNIVHKEVDTSGYGYVGINPRFVPNITVRRAIMKAMNTDIIFDNYYSGGLAEPIYRSMSKTSWAYPEGCTVYKNEALGLDYSYDGTGYQIEEMLEADGYTKNSQGIYSKNIPGYGTDTLEYTFTIAGRSTDHPAYAMFLDAAQRLNNHGFRIRVVTSQTALSDLTTGKLAVWAAAWTSAIDPDMYQVYHKDSMATSVNNWGYRQIKANKTLYATEWAIIEELSQKIDDARATNEQQERKEIYSEALDLVMELAVEMPTYQRKDMSAYNADLLDASTMTADEDLTPYNGLLSRIWEVNYL